MKLMHTGNINWIDNGSGTKYARITLPKKAVTKHPVEYQMIENEDGSYTLRLE